MNESPEPALDARDSGPSAEATSIDRDRLRRLIDVGRELSGVSDTDTVIQSALTAARDLTGARYAALAILDSRRTEVEHFLTLGIDEATREAIGDMPHQRGVLGLLAKSSEPILLDDITSHPDSYGFPENHPPMGSFLGVPIKISGEPWGNLYLTDKGTGSFNEADEESAVVLADWIALAITNARSAEAERVRLSIEGAERERRRWARELHDETLQDLAGLRVLLSGTRRRTGGDPELDKAIGRIDATIDEMRRLIADLRPASLDELGVGAALASLVDRITGTREMEVDLQVDLPDQEGERLAPELEVTIYRLAQEALNNAVQHGRAERAIVEVIERDDQIEVRVTDDGSGFDPDRPSEGFGLLGMRERVSLAGGRIEIRSDRPGTTVKATLPARRP